MRENSALRAVWLAIIIVVSIVAGIAAALLSVAGGMEIPPAILAGAAAFAGATVLLLQVVDSR